MAKKKIADLEDKSRCNPLFGPFFYIIFAAVCICAYNATSASHDLGPFKDLQSQVYTLNNLVLPGSICAANEIDYQLLK